MLKRLSVIAGFTSAGVLLVGLIGLHLVDFSHSPEEVVAAFSDLPFKPAEFSLDVAGRLTHGIQVGDPKMPAIVFVHGSPGTWDNFLDLMSDPLLLQNAHLIAFDRPGFGKSEPNKVEKSLPRLAAVVEQVIHRFAANQSAVLVGHSYGGAAIAQTAFDYPERVAGLVMVAASISPRLEEKYWYNHIAEWRLVNWALPKELLTSNREISALKSELTRLAPHLSSIERSVVIIHGQKDQLVPYENVAFMIREFRSAEVLVKTDPSWGHFIPWEQPQVIRESLLSLIKKSSPVYPGHAGQAAVTTN
jgi:pimeloyl-ACP methyl ester carboxylesterase